jgi:glycosyltransferase involved in cell wall biosynthesis
MKPEISIIVPIYNVEPYLRKCLNSILEQTFTNFELILVNDGSTDKSAFICDEYAVKDDRVKVIHKDYGGVSSARNVGIKLARGNYIGFVDSDDYIEKNMYKILYHACIDSKSDIAICKLGREVNSELTNNDIGEFYIKEFNNQEALRELFKGILYRFSLCNKLFNKTMFNNIRFPEGRIHEDLSTTYKLFGNSNKSIYINYIGYIYIKQQNSILTSTFSEKRLDALIGWDEIMTYMFNNYPQLANNFVSSFSYGCIDNIYYILSQVVKKENKIKYLDQLKKHVRKYYKEIINNSTLSFKSKLLLTFISFNPALFLFSYEIKNWFFIKGNHSKQTI